MDIQSLYLRYLQSGKVSTDTRQITPGSVFFALKGPNFNANAFADEALQKGASDAIVDEVSFVKNDNYILVDDALRALQLLARHHRRQLKIPVLGITGSNGKTTTKELIQAVLSRKYRTLATRGNLNNHIGVPLTILSVDSSVEIAIIEMGANHLGEIMSLCEMADPTHGLITNIGKAHIGTFGSFENIVRAKSELYQYLLTHSGTVFINSQNPILNNMAKRFEHPICYPAKGDYCYAELISSDPFLKIVTEGGETLNTQLTGAYNFENVAASICVGKYFGVGASLVHEAIASYVPGNMRSQIMEKGTNKIILDAYNANPSSMAAAIDNLSTLKTTRKIAILGDMYELGNESEVEHKTLGSLLLEKGIKEVYFCGPLIRVALDTFPAAKYFVTRDELIEELHKNPIRNATVLVKASRGMGLEKIVEEL